MSFLCKLHYQNRRFPALGIFYLSKWLLVYIYSYNHKSTFYRSWTIKPGHTDSYFLWLEVKLLLIYTKVHLNSQEKDLDFFGLAFTKNKNILYTVDSHLFSVFQHFHRHFIPVLDEKGHQGHPSEYQSRPADRNRKFLLNTAASCCQPRWRTLVWICTKRAERGGKCHAVSPSCFTPSFPLRQLLT